MKICTNGCTRIVILIGQYAFKIPGKATLSINISWKMFLEGLLANMQETSFNTLNNSKLCPIIFSFPGGFLNIMYRAQPLSDFEWYNLDYDTYIKDMDNDQLILPVENKRDSFGTIKGKIVVVDYGN